MEDKGNWQIRLIAFGSGVEQIPAITALTANKLNKSVSFTLDRALDPAAERVDVIFSCNFNYSVATVGKPKAPVKTHYVAAKGKQDADIYLSGTGAAAREAGPLYTISAKLGYSEPIGADGNLGSVGIKGALDTSDEPNADPDSITGAVSYRKVFAKTAYTKIVNVDFARGELDRQGDTKTFVPGGTAIIALPSARVGKQSYLTADFSIP